jgi:hypothetical protein
LKGKRSGASACGDAIQAGPPLVPWARWRDWEELRARSTALDKEIETATKVCCIRLVEAWRSTPGQSKMAWDGQLHKVERAITAEVHQLSALGCYPMEELQQMRKDCQAYHDQEATRPSNDGPSGDATAAVDEFQVSELRRRASLVLALF